MLERLARAAYRRLAPNARNALRSWLLLDARDQAAPWVTAFTEQRVCVLAPHPDDETLGCGGTLLRHHAAGAQIQVLVMTDGRWGQAGLFEPGLTEAARVQQQAKLVQRREAEAREACAVLGVQDLHFLGECDGALRPHQALVDRLAQTLQVFSPEIIYLPFIFDLHEDHWQTNRIFAAALAQLPLARQHRLRVRGYEVWTPLAANCLVDITQTMADKQRALATYSSQMQDQDYARMVLGLNAYRSAGALGGRGYAEAFFECHAAAYARLVQASSLRAASPANGAWSLAQGATP